MSLLRQSALALLARPSLCPHRSIAPLSCRVPRRLFSLGATPNVPRPPLKILFFGSDHFSATSLKALYALHQRRRDIIASIDVLCREDKLSGRGRRTLKEGMPFAINFVCTYKNKEVDGLTILTSMQPLSRKWQVRSDSASMKSTSLRTGRYIHSARYPYNCPPP